MRYYYILSILHGIRTRKGVLFNRLRVQRGSTVQRLRVRERSTPSSSGHWITPHLANRGAYDSHTPFSLSVSATTHQRLTARPMYSSPSASLNDVFGHFPTWSCGVVNDLCLIIFLWIYLVRQKGLLSLWISDCIFFVDLPVPGETEGSCSAYFWF